MWRSRVHYFSAPHLLIVAQRRIITARTGSAHAPSVSADRRSRSSAGCRCSSAPSAPSRLRLTQAGERCTARPVDLHTQIDAARHGDSRATKGNHDPRRQPRPGPVPFCPSSSTRQAAVPGDGMSSRSTHRTALREHAAERPLQALSRPDAGPALRASRCARNCADRGASHPFARRRSGALRSCGRSLHPRSRVAHSRARRAQLKSAECCSTRHAAQGRIGEKA